MSYAALSDNASFLDSHQLPAVLELFEGNISRVYNDGSGNPTIGIGLNLDSSDNMAVVLYQLAPSLFASQTVAQTSVEGLIQIIQDNPLPANGQDDAHTNPSAATQNLINLLNQQLATDLGSSVDELTSSFSNLSAQQARTALTDALEGGTVIPNYPIVGYSPGTMNWLSGSNPYHISVHANIPEQNTGAWEALLTFRTSPG